MHMLFYGFNSVEEHMNPYWYASRQRSHRAYKSGFINEGQQKSHVLIPLPLTNAL